jgi:crotonobetainyl-CoA hydratase
MSAVVDVSVRNSIAVVRLDRPDRLNAVNARMRAELYDAIEQIECDPLVRVTILTGTGSRAFCAGADLEEMGQGYANRLTARGGFAGFVRHDRAKPVIAAVNGLAYGGGFEIVLACDLVVAADHAVFALPEVKRGIVAGGGGVLRLSRALPPAVARELLLTGSPLAADQALRWGLVNRVVAPSDLISAAEELAVEITRGAPVAITATLAVSRALDRLIEGVGWLSSDQAVERVRLTSDAREGPRAFAERREPVWTGA